MTTHINEWLTSSVFKSRVERTKKSVDEQGWKHTYDGMAVSEEMKVNEAVPPTALTITPALVIRLVALVMSLRTYILKVCPLMSLAEPSSLTSAMLYAFP